MNTHSGRMLRVAIAQNGIFLRALAAATTGMSGFGAGGAAGAALAGAAAAGRAAGAAASVVAGVAAAGVAPPSSGAGAPEAFAFAAWLRLRRCSGISVTPVHDRRHVW